LIQANGNAPVLVVVLVCLDFYRHSNQGNLQAGSHGKKLPPWQASKINYWRRTLRNMADSFHLPWQDPAWMEQAHGWIYAEAARHSIQITGAIEQPHLYPWSTVLIVPTGEGRLFFKATAPETFYEAALTQKLSDWIPDCMPELLAVDPLRGWMLMCDGGEQLRQFIRPIKDVQPWAPIVPRYAEVQIELVEHVPEILSLGIPDHRLALLPTLYSGLLVEEESLMIDQEKGLSASEFQELKEKTARFGQICSDLAGLGIPESLNQCDFHDGNVLIKNGRVTFFDWGDVNISHPFVSLRTFFVSIEISLQLDDYAFTEEMEALLNLYLERWESFGSREELARAYRLSKPVASIVKALLWHAGIIKMERTVRLQYAWIVPELLKEFLYHEKRLPG
jgi:hypothetical protein